ncbi:MAG: M20/M25/M40 family metallo-hydrolase [Blastocatellia bacterium]|nr:M20/M25/M40 family metallo-hydrolase [Blastocatellia bacterium]MCS7156290.1 M20/M25/M40 family metallo-hydrolase [Blastocatellia bacterium]MCX7751360.1 M20/M25/M40 family metallo-hydrolase [Blastocatellia bacterium]MDW8169072.1 M20/M25/M40 family metallo-hydrolase [Acidobacteriota bacterium]MDW8255777.1 M20/M25/M40 family metallo-hydrolase [Acidobacteriota bacterium]
MPHWKRHVVLLLVFLSLGAGIRPSATLPLPPAAAMESITPAELRSHVEFLASDELGGRYVASDSIHIAARYLASRLRSYGFRGGAADGSFFQAFDIVVRRLLPDQTALEMTTPAGKRTYAYGTDFVIFGGTGPVDLQAELVFVRFGVSLPEWGYDDYAKVNVSGKIAVALLGGLPSLAREGRALTAQDYPVQRKIEAARARGAAGLLFLRDTPGAGGVRGFRGAGLAPRIALAEEDARMASSFPVLVADTRLTEDVLGALGLTLERLATSPEIPASRPLGLTASVRITFETHRQQAANVIGILDGADPERRNEYVLLSAHYDHLQTRDGQIYNGADDDASGTATVLEIAQAFTIGERPKRSILVIFHTAEEVGLLGSKYFVTHPTVPLTAIVANLNLDMVGRSRAPNDTNPANRELSDANTIYLIGSDKLSRELHELSEQTNRDTERFILDYRYNREDHPQRLYYRSDHYNYAQKGIPVIFYFTGLHEDYHRPTDDTEKLDFEKMARIGRLVFATAWRIANREHRLRVDQPMDGARTN